MALACTGILCLGAVVNHLLAAGKFVAIAFVPPRGDHLQIRRERGGGQFKPHLVVPLPRRAVRDGVGLFLFGDFHHALGDERARNAGAEKILALVNGPGADDREDEVARELLLQIVNVDFRRAGLFGLGLEAGQFVFLADVGAEGDHFGVVFFLDPGKQDGRVESAGVCENNFHAADIKPRTGAKGKIETQPEARKGSQSEAQGYCAFCGARHSGRFNTTMQLDIEAG